MRSAFSAQFTLLSIRSIKDTILDSAATVMTGRYLHRDVPCLYVGDLLCAGQYPGVVAAQLAVNARVAQSNQERAEMKRPLTALETGLRIIHPI